MKKSGLFHAKDPEIIVLNAAHLKIHSLNSQNVPHQRSEAMAIPNFHMVESGNGCVEYHRENPADFLVVFQKLQ